MEKRSHAYIVSAASIDTGMERSMAIAMEILCSGAGEKPCGVCRDCRKVKARVHPDLAIIGRPVDDKGKKKKEIQIDQIRAMGADAYVLPNEAASKVYIIEEAEAMNERAQNAALKLFEEPPAGVCFILCTTNPEKLLITVRSRCMTVRCNVSDDEENEEAAELADEYIGLLAEGSAPKLTAWCFEHEVIDTILLTDMLFGIKRRLVNELAADIEKQYMMKNIELIDRCLEYQKVNTSAKHIFGLLAVRSVMEETS